MGAAALSITKFIPTLTNTPWYHCGRTYMCQSRLSAKTLRDVSLKHSINIRKLKKKCTYYFVNTHCESLLVICLCTFPNKSQYV